MKKAMIKAITLLLLLTVILSACNFGNDIPTPDGDYTVVTSEEARPLPSDFLTRQAISYSGYRDGQSPGDRIYPSEAEILEDLTILNSMDFTLLRLYDTTTHAARVLKVIKENNLDMKVMLGVWISGSRAVYNGKNTSTCDQAVTWAKGDYNDQIVAVSIGNECMVDWNTFGWATPPADIAYYVTYVREQITQPVTVDDNWEPWSLENEQGTSAYATVYMAAEAVDFIALHTYAIADAQWNLWDYKQTGVVEVDRADAMMDAAIDFAKENYYAAKNALADIGITKPIIIGETGWQSEGNSVDIGHPVNQRMYYDKMNEWMASDPNAPKTTFYFEAFDESWKQSDDHWGFFNKDREAKYIVYSEDILGNTWDDLGFTPEDDDLFTLDKAAYFIPLLPLHIVDSSNSSFHIFADDVTPGFNGQILNDGLSTENLKWEAWENNSTAGTNLDDATANSEDTEVSTTDTVAVITPDPATFGWGMMALMRRQGFDLSAFANGNLEFRIKTSYPGKLEVGFQTGREDEQTGMDLIITIDLSTASSYISGPDGNGWYDISIPIQELISAATPGYNMPLDTVYNLAEVYVPFVIADRYGVTNNAPKDNNGSLLELDSWLSSNTSWLEPIIVDQVRWTK